MKVVILNLILGSAGCSVWSLSMKSMTGCDKVCGEPRGAPEPGSGSKGSQTR